MLSYTRQLGSAAAVLLISSMLSMVHAQSSFTTGAIVGGLMGYMLGSSEEEAKPEQRHIDPEQKLLISNVGGVAVTFRTMTFKANQWAFADQGSELIVICEGRFRSIGGKRICRVPQDGFTAALLGLHNSIPATPLQEYIASHTLESTAFEIDAVEVYGRNELVVRYRLN